MAFSAIALLGALVYTFLNFLKQVANKQWNAVLTQLTSWGAGVAGMFLFGASAWAGQINVGGTTIAGLSWPSKLLIGLCFASVAGGFNNTLVTFGLKHPAMFPRQAAKDAAPTPPPAA